MMSHDSLHTSLMQGSHYPQAWYHLALDMDVRVALP
jgi:hypothetical protein